MKQDDLGMEIRGKKKVNVQVIRKEDETRENEDCVVPYLENYN